MTDHSRALGNDRTLIVRQDGNGQIVLLSVRSPPSPCGFSGFRSETAPALGG